MRIGEFADICGLSVKMLRHYDELGLLVPEVVDASSGYRYYSPWQLGDVHRIAALRRLDFPLKDIKRILADGGANIDDDLRRRRVVVRREVRRLAELIIDIDDRLARGPSPMVRLYEAPGGAYRVVRGEVVSRGGASSLFHTLEGAVARDPAGRRAPRPPLLAVLGETLLGFDVEVAVPVRSAKGRGVRHVPRRQMASTVVTGDYAAVPAATEAVIRWAAHRNLRPVGAMEEVYLRFSAGEGGAHAIADDVLVENPNNFVTEVRVEVA